MNRGKEVSIGSIPEIRKMCGAIEYSIEFRSKDDFDFAAVKIMGISWRKQKILMNLTELQVGWHNTTEKS